jgi:hypothetical protein
MVIGVIFFIVVAVLIACSLRRKPAVVDNPPLNKTCLSCGEPACEVSRQYVHTDFIAHDVRCAACGKFNVEPQRGGRQYAIDTHNRNVAEQQQKKKDLRALLEEAARQGVDPQNFEQWLRSKGL